MATESTLRRRRRYRRLLTFAAPVAAVVLTAGVAAAGVGLGSGGDQPFGTELAGQHTPHGILLPSNQYLTPIGTRTLISNGRLLSSALAPDGTTMAALSWEQFNGFLSVFNVKTGTLIQQVGTGTTSDPTLGDGTVAADGPFYSPDGTALYMPQSADILKFSVNPDGTVNTKPTVIAMPKGPHGDALPSGMAFSADGKTAYVALNGNNTLAVLDLATGTVTRQIPVGNAPRQVVLAGGRAYVSDEGGRVSRPGDFTNLSDGTPIVASPVTGAATTGTVSVVSLASQAQTGSIKVGLEPTALYLDGRTLMVANSNDDSVSLIDTGSNQVTQTFNVNPTAGVKIGSYPTAIAMDGPHTLLVSIGRDNAIAVFGYDNEQTPVRYEGLLPTDWYPVNVTVDARLGGKIIVTNDKGIGARGTESTIAKGPGTLPVTGGATGHNTYDDTGSLTTFTMPSAKKLGFYTHQVFVDNNWTHLTARTGAGGDGVIPTRIGGSSPIKHVFLIVKENRTYDQVLGDIGKGNSDPSLAEFGKVITPNAHALANQFGLYDNFYDEGTLSADGHNWLMQADANDYLEREFGAFYRSYPAQGGDALAYQRDGFLWNDAARAGKTAADFGEYQNYLDLPSPTPTWQQFYQDAQILRGKASGPLPVPESGVNSYADIPSLNAISDHEYPRFDLGISDQYRADVWQQSFARSEKTGKLANLNMIWLPDDHTAGVGSGDPYPVAEVADNDLALGRIVDTISHSRFWKSTAIFVLEDDPQNGVDHVDGHRSVLWTISPYARHGAINNTYYSQINVVKTIEMILGMRPMNTEDAAAEPMYNAFTSHPDFAPYTYRPNNVSLTYGLSGVEFGTAAQAKAAARRFTGKPVIPASEKTVYEQWAAWSRHQHFNGPKAVEDAANPQQFNRLDWYAATGWTRPYPGDSKILAPSQVPGRSLSASYIG